MLTINLDSARRFIMGRQGLWPGRRWRGLDGAAQAMRAMAYLQLDPLQMIARSQDIALCSRVLDYRPGMWEDVTYGQRQFFDWGGWLAVRPMDELPYWRVVMRREQQTIPRLLEIAREHPEAIVEMRDYLRENETASNRDFKAAARKRTQSYRGSKDSSLALYYLWRVGEVMTHHRENFERVYALSEHVAPDGLLAEAAEDDTDRFLIRKELDFYGLSRLANASDSYRRGLPSRRLKNILDGMIAAGDVVPLRVEGWKFQQYALGADMPLLEEVIAGRVPSSWEPVHGDNTQEAIFLSPLDPAAARGRARELFGFDYVWEVYKPQDKRQYGYYVLPVLWGDRLVARFDSKMDRTTNTFTVLGFWLEDEALGQDEAFAAALARAFARFAAFLGADAFDAQAIAQPLLRSHAAAAL